MPVLQDTYYLNTNVPDYLRKSFAANLIRYAPGGMCPLFGLTGFLPPAKCFAVEHGYFSKTLVFPSVTINNGGGYNTTDTTFTVVSSANVIPGEMLRVQSTGEVVRVTSVASATSIVVVRAVGQINTSAGVGIAIANSVKLYSIGNAFEQASNAPQSRLINPARVMNTTQIFRNAWALPKTVKVIQTIVGEGNLAESRRDCAHFHGSDIERSILFGQQSQTFVGGQYMTTMDGIVEVVRRLAPAGNTTVAGSTTNYTQLETALNPCFDTITGSGTGKAERWLFCGGRAKEVITAIGRLSGTFQLDSDSTAFGLQFDKFKTSRGLFKIVEHPMLNTNDDWKKMAIAVDVDSMRVPHLRETENEEFGMDGRYVASGQDAVGGCMTTELTTEFTNPSACAVIYGLTAGASG